MLCNPEEKLLNNNKNALSLVFRMLTFVDNYISTALVVAKAVASATVASAASFQIFFISAFGVAILNNAGLLWRTDTPTMLQRPPCCLLRCVHF